MPVESIDQAAFDEGKRLVAQWLAEIRATRPPADIARGRARLDAQPGAGVGSLIQPPFTEKAAVPIYFAGHGW